MTINISNNILVVDDDEAILSSLKILLTRNGYGVYTCSTPSDAINYIRINSPRLVLLDMNFGRSTNGEEGIELLRKVKVFQPNVPVILMTGWGSIALAVEGMKCGATDFITKPWQNALLLESISNALKLRQNIDSFINANRAELDQQFKFDAIIGESPRLIDVLRTVGRIAKTSVPVLITGESGTGKELIAEAIHINSNRVGKPFVKVNLGGIAPSLFESEMFGHKKGAFTDAKSDRIGRFELANEGTIFLDEIGELDLSSQVKLLRVLQEHTFEVLGDSKAKSVDVRVLCATNRDLRSMVEQGTFREDLYYRINLITIAVPALRERHNDITILAKHFLANICFEQRISQNITFSRAALEWLKKQTFSGNVRELKNLIERTVLLSESEVIDVLHLSSNQIENPKSSTEISINNTILPTIDEMEKALIIKAMDTNGGNISQIARLLGLSRGALYRRLDKYGIPYETKD